MALMIQTIIVVSKPERRRRVLTSERIVGGLGSSAESFRPMGKDRWRNVFGSTVYNWSSHQHLRSSYQAARPFPHVVLRQLFNQDFLKEARDEAIRHLVAQPKETDLFKVFQVPEDLSCISSVNKSLASRIPCLMTLREALASQPFLDLLGNVTGVKDLSPDRIDCSVNVYVKGNHLLCHDDVIGSRRLSYIIYLVDQHPRWNKSEGGRLELYPPGGSSPECYVTPEWNSMIVFKVDPGRSFHAVEEVFGDRPRLTVSGWYHPPPDLEVNNPKESEGRKSSREDIKSSECGSKFRPALGCEGVPNTHAEDTRSPLHALKPEDIDYLSRYINPSFLNHSHIQSIHSKILKSSSALLTPFLNTPSLPASLWRNERGEIREEISGIREFRQAGWEEVGPAHKRRFLEYSAESKDILKEHRIERRNIRTNRTAIDLEGRKNLNNNSTRKRCRGTMELGLELERLQTELFLSGAFQRYLMALSGLRTCAVRSSIRYFRRGKDYCVAYGGGLGEGNLRLDVTLCFALGSQSEWQASNMGGFEAYIAAPTPISHTGNSSIEDTGSQGGSDSDEAATCRVGNPTTGNAREDDEPQDTDQDQTDDQGCSGGSMVLCVDSVFNALSIVVRDAGTLKFVKYLEREAPGDRLDVASEFDVHRDDIIT
uniref:Fe2OG dioxygenase domain-containing protein n=1 Tax=Amorphochlora amoebiformis TaxID=1561963 RepID=A0A7S0D2P2_9EUKA